MKTSYRLLIIAVLILFGTMTVYDFALKAEYEKGTYRNEHETYTGLTYKNFDQIEINPADNTNVDIIYSPTFNVSVNNSVKDYLEIRQVGSKLIVDLDMKKQGFPTSGKSLIITCPLIKVVETNAVYRFKGQEIVTDKLPSGTYFNGRVFIKGFKQDSLTLIMKNFSSIYLQNNKVRYVAASIGAGKSGESSLYINKSNQINSVDIDLQNKSKLNLNDLTIDRSHFKIADSAHVYLSGASLKLLER